jgi:hypothetical protein
LNERFISLIVLQSVPVKFHISQQKVGQYNILYLENS